MKSLIAAAGTHVFWIALLTAVYFSVAYFDIDVTAFTEKTDSRPVPARNALLDLPAGVFYAGAKPIVKAHPNGSQCAEQWQRGDPGSLDCRLLENRLASHFDVDQSDVANHQLWTRYFVEQSRSVTQAIINY